MAREDLVAVAVRIFAVFLLAIGAKVAISV